ncbi:ribosome recycling factor [Corynebacterium sp. 320]|uniref:Ribosome-recycling factor n=1 Tax=Corynebacterium zhongnanshanii TaxID=2768834 RepID=A0ABQ6VG01_9CORY|nr:MULTISPECIES: ribosome recycling factor [Corynebacterium]KAB1503814.1 ribosome recycling factor [Corynebacterium sp. 320]KAB1553087.1 ribosome recycling factor [Corynebacterium sp. 321]KAB1553695.1 ribosome recycling factor [Corynebacterium sp. 319]KAB3523335.1 ribosome recycling factor [Corynebacterium zhongnanshanii]KAB3527950.1 ribosome recycling factor [Corynebacterium sp. 250]
MIDDILLDSEERMTSSVEHAREDLTTIRTGRANPAMFNGVMAEYYGALTPITQMATISVPEPRMLLIKPYEQSLMNDIENAIRNSDLGVNPTNDGQVLRVTIPQLTEERRRELVKMAKSKGEDAKIAIRNIRRKGMEQLGKIQKDGEAGEDEVKAAEKELEKVTHNYVTQVDALVSNKESELMEV